MKTPALVQSRPAETGTGTAAALLVVLVWLFDLPVEVAGAFIVIVGSLPGIITRSVEWYRTTKG